MKINSKINTKKLMNNDLFLKALSLVLAILCWIYIVFITNPEIEVKINNIPITLANHQVIKNEGYIVANEITTTVDIKVKGTRRMLANLDENSIIAYVDLIECIDKKTYDLPVNIKLPYDGIKLVSSNTPKISISVDSYVTRAIPIEILYSGELKDSHYEIGSTELSTLNYSPSENPSITVSGPEPILNTIEKAVITIDLENASEDITGFVPVVLLNSNNMEVSSLTLDIKNKDISFRCNVIATKVVPIKPEISDSANYECKVQGDNLVTIKGPASKINARTEISTNTINVREDETLYTTTLSIPEGITVLENIKTVTVQVTKK